MDALVQDLRFGARKLAASPGFTAVAVLTLALGIGANATIFSLLDAVLLRPLRLDDPDRVLYIRDRFPGREMDLVSVPNSDDYRAGTTDLFSRFGAFQRTPIFLEGPDGDRELRGLYVSGDVLRMTTFEPRAGRYFTAAEDEGALEHVAILTHDFCQLHFDRAEDAVGRTLRMKYFSSGIRAGQPRGFHGELFTVVGVLPPDFELPPVVGPRGFQIHDPEVLIPMGPASTPSPRASRSTTPTPTATTARARRRCRSCWRLVTVRSSFSWAARSRSFCCSHASTSRPCSSRARRRAAPSSRCAARWARTAAGSPARC